MRLDHLFEAALAAFDTDDLDGFTDLLRRHPPLARHHLAGDAPPYDGYFHRPTLLHHAAGNPTRGELPPRVMAFARALLAAGADVDAPCGGGPAQPESTGGTTLGLVVSSARAHIQGVSEGLIDLLLDSGAALDAEGNGGLMWLALYHTVEHRGQRDVAAMLRRRGHEVDLCFAAGLGELETVRRYLAVFPPDPAADRLYRHHRPGPAATPAEVIDDAFLFACITNHLDAARLLRAHGARIDRFRPWAGETVTPLHGAAWAGWPDAVRYLIDEGAKLNSTDPNHHASPLVWARHRRRDDVAAIITRAGGR